MFLPRECIESALKQYQLPLLSVDEEVDTSHGETDWRYHYFVNGQYVLHCAWGAPMEEERLREIALLRGHYEAIGLYCPPMLQTAEGRYSVKIQALGKEFSCYLEEKAPYETADIQENLDERQLRRETCRMLGRLAAAYTGKGLSRVRSMWSLIDLAPLDVDVDEKQENMNALLQALREAGASSLARRLQALNEAARARIQRDYQALPRCFYQGDLNDSNLLVKDGHLAGLIDFNMSGTEVNINCFLCETDHFPSEEALLTRPPDLLYAAVKEKQRREMQEIQAYYPLNDLEKELLPYYRAVIFLSQWPNVCQMRKMLKEEKGRKAILEFLEYAVMQHEEWVENAYHLETERLRLRPFREGDYPLILGISSDPETVKYLYYWGRPGITPEADAHRFLRYALEEWGKAPIRAREYCVMDKASGEAMGDGSVEYAAEKTAEIGWILLPQYRGKGYVTEMGRELLRYAFEEMGVEKTIAHCDALNAPSYRVMERLGMHLESLEKEARPAKTEGGKKGDEMTWAMTRTEWEERQKCIR